MIWLLLVLEATVFGFDCPKGSEFSRRKLGSKWVREFCKVKDQKMDRSKLPEMFYYSTGAKMSGGLTSDGQKIGLWKSWAASGSFLKEQDYGESGEENCAPKRKISKDESILGYSKGSQFYPLLAINRKEIKAYHRLESPPTLALRNVLTGVSYAASFGPPRHDAATMECVFPAKLKSDPPKFSVLAFGPPVKVWTPNKDEQVQFSRVKQDCVQREESSDVSEKADCVSPKLLAVSDIDGNGKKEFWFTDPYIYEDGFQIAELDLAKNVLNPIVQDCSDCAD